MALQVITFQNTVNQLKADWNKPSHAINKAFNSIINNPEYEGFRLDYPPIKYTFTDEELQTLNQNDLLNLFNNDINRQIELGDNLFETPLEKFLFSIIWKQSDCQLIRTLKIGMSILPNDNNNEGVFVQFGR
jgi:hypothetical protein